MAEVRTGWTWGHGQSCDIRDGAINIASADPWGGAGASCTLREFVDGQLTWLLPDDVRSEALAAAQAILGDDRPLRPAVLRGDEGRLAPGSRARQKQRAKDEEARDVEQARLARRLTRRDIPDADCFICLRLHTLYALNRSGFEKVLARFPHARHQAAAATLDQKLAEFAAGLHRLPLADCEMCRALPDEVSATRSQTLPPAALRVLELPALTPFGPHYRQCPHCGRLYRQVVHNYEWNDDPGPDAVGETLTRRDWPAVRDELRAGMAEGAVPEWVERAMPNEPELTAIPWKKLKKARERRGRRS